MQFTTGRISPLLLASCAVLACSAIVLWQGFTANEPFARPFVTTKSLHPGALLVVAFRPEDCEGNLDFLAVLERPELRDSVRTLALLNGSEEEFKHAINRLEERFPNVTFSRMSRRHARTLAVLGHASTPFWVLMDRSGAIRASSPAPSNPMGYGEVAELFLKFSRSQ